AGAPEALAALLRRHESGWAGASAGGAFLVDHPIGTDETSTGILGAAVLLASAVPGRVLLPLHPDLLGDGANHAAARPGPVADLAGSEALWALRELTAAVGGRRIVLTCTRFPSPSRPSCAAPRRASCSTRGSRAAPAIATLLTSSLVGSAHPARRSRMRKRSARHGPRGKRPKGCPRASTSTSPGP